jgi:hypothetical protein
LEKSDERIDGAMRRGRILVSLELSGCLSGNTRGTAGQRDRWMV